MQRLYRVSHAGKADDIRDAPIYGIEKTSARRTEINVYF